MDGAIRPQTLSRVICETIGRQILSGALPPGTRIIPDSVEKGFGVSRTACREGIAVLVSKGLITAKPNTGTVVTPHDRWSLVDPDVLDWAPIEGWIGDSARRLLAHLAEGGGHVDYAFGDAMARQLVDRLRRFVQ